MNTTVRGKTFVSTDEVLDGKDYFNCKFEKCQLVYKGGDVPNIDGCEFKGCTWSFLDNAANTLNFLVMLHETGGGDEVVEKIFDLIKKRGPAK